MEIRELEKAIRRIVQADHPKPLLATLAGSLPAEFAEAAGTLAERAQERPVTNQVVQAKGHPWF